MLGWVVGCDFAAPPQVERVTLKGKDKAAHDSSYYSSSPSPAAKPEKKKKPQEKEKDKVKASGCIDRAEIAAKRAYDEDKLQEMREYVSELAKEIRESEELFQRRWGATSSSSSNAATKAKFAPAIDTAEASDQKRAEKKKESKGAAAKEDKKSKSKT